MLIFTKFVFSFHDWRIKFCTKSLNSKFIFKPNLEMKQIGRNEKKNKRVFGPTAPLSAQQPETTRAAHLLHPARRQVGLIGQLPRAPCVAAIWVPFVSRVLPRVAYRSLNRGPHASASSPTDSANAAPGQQTSAMAAARRA